MHTYSEYSTFQKGLEYLKNIIIYYVTKETINNSWKRKHLQNHKVVALENNKRSKQKYYTNWMFKKISQLTTMSKR